VLILVLLISQPIWFVARALWRGEAFYHGIPSSVWRSWIQAELDVRDRRLQKSFVWWPRQASPMVDRLMGQVPILGAMTNSALAQVSEAAGSSEIVPLLIDLLKDPDVLVQSYGFGGLMQGHPNAIQAVPALL
jgi:hypothetical protein